MSATPLISNLQNNGGTFYSFSSAVNQESMAANNDDVKFSFSKFAALKIPSIKTPTYKNNNVQFLTIDGQIFDGVSSFNSVNLIQSFQNYCLNLENLILNDDGYDTSELKTTSERVFFKWLKELGAIRFRTAYDNEATSARFVEEEDSQTGGQRYERVVKYVGDIDIVNNVNYKGSNFNEVYINMPANVGNTPTVLFDTISDNNYQPDLTITGNDEYIHLRDSETIHPDNLSVNAYFDYDSSVDYVNSTNANWYDQDPIAGNTNSYFTEPTEFDNPSNIEITKDSNDYSGADSFSTFSYLRSQLDGISLDFNPTSYTDIINDNSINTIQEYNSHGKSSNFDFNCVLIYYNVYRESDPSVVETNLYGILVLNNLVEEIDESYLPSYQKHKFNPIINQNGNSFGLKVLFKNSQSILRSSVETIINDYNTFSMDLFSDTMVELQKSVVNFQEQNSQLIDLDQRIQLIENFMYSVDDMTLMKARMTNLETSVQNAQIALADSTVIIDMIANLNNRLDSILQNESSIEMQYNTDVIQAGKGITIDKSVPNKFIINNNSEHYNVCLVKDENNNTVDYTNQFDPELNEPKLHIINKEYTNYVKLHTLANSELDTHFNIYINDKNNLLKNGQVIKIIFQNNIDFKSYNLRIFSDYYNKFGSGSLEHNIININYSELSAKPYIEIICLNKDQYIFDYNIIR